MKAVSNQRTIIFKLITNTAILILIALFTGRALAQEQTEQDKERIRKAKIKLYSEVEHLYKFGEPEENGKKIVEISYDGYGNLTEQSVFGEEGELMYRSTFAFDANNNKIEEAIYSGGDLEYRYVYKFDGDLLKEKVNYGSGGDIEAKFIYDYTGFGEIEKETEYTSDGEIVSRKVYQYTDARKLEKSILYDAEGVPTEKYSYRYDDAGNLVEIIVYDEEGAVLSKNQKKFDNASRLTEELVYDGDGSLMSKKSMKYDDAGNLIESTTFGDGGSMLENIKYKYDENGRVAEETKFEEGDRIYTKKMSYNSKGDISELLDDQPNDDIYIKIDFQYDSARRVTEKTVYDRLNEPIKLIKVNYDLY